MEFAVYSLQYALARFNQAPTVIQKALIAYNFMKHDAPHMLEEMKKSITRTEDKPNGKPSD